MASKKNSGNTRRQIRNPQPAETDGGYFLKLVLYVIVGSVWLRLGTPIELFGVVITSMPIGLFIGLMFAHHDHFQIDRKIEYAILIIVTVLSYFLPTGIVL